MTATKRTRQRQRRILLSVPDVALGAEIGLPEIATEHLESMADTACPCFTHPELFFASRARSSANYP